MSAVLLTPNGMTQEEARQKRFELEEAMYAKGHNVELLIGPMRTDAHDNVNVVKWGVYYDPEAKA